jgi:dienelactone hydrolase
VVGRGRRTLPGTSAGRRALLGFLLVGLASMLLAPVSRGIDVSRTTVGPDGDVPVRLYVPRSVGEVAAPGVVVVHGFAGSAALMHTWSLALAHAGFVVAAPDLPGHGASTVAHANRATDQVASVEATLEHLRATPGVDGGRIGLLGHSMGSGAVLRVGIARPELIDAVVAVSPTDADVSPTVPRDLLLLAGANETRFVANAESLLERSGGAGGSPGAGDARSLVVIPFVEHVSILFARPAHDASIAWLSSVLGHEPTGRAPTGPLAGWALLAVGVLVLWQALVTAVASPAAASVQRSAPWLSLPVGGVAATASLVIVARSMNIPAATGILIAGEVGLWFLMAGAVWLRFGIRPARPEARDVGWALLAALMVVILGATTTLAWAPWWLTGRRPVAAVILSLLVLPAMVAFAALLQDRRARSAVGVWLFVSVAIVVALGAAAAVIPGLGFLMLVLPLLPLVLAATVATAVGVDRPWATGAAGAVLVGWLLAMLFPLA